MSTEHLWCSTKHLYGGCTGIGPGVNVLLRRPCLSLAGQDILGHINQSFCLLPPRLPLPRLSGIVQVVFSRSLQFFCLSVVCLIKSNVHLVFVLLVDYGLALRSCSIINYFTDPSWARLHWTNLQPLCLCLSRWTSPAATDESQHVWQPTDSHISTKH